MQRLMNLTLAWQFEAKERCSWMKLGNPNGYCNTKKIKQHFLFHWGLAVLLFGAYTYIQIAWSYPVT